MGGPAPAGGLSALRDEIVAHGGCGYEPCETATRSVPGDGNPDAAVVFVGEAPGKTEDELGRPFMGRAGKLLDELLAEAGVVRADVWITNVVKARPPKNRDPKAPEIAHWMPFLERELELIQPQLIVPLGPARAQALRAGGQDRRGARHARSTGGCSRSTTRPRRCTTRRCKATLFEDARALGALLSSTRRS